jgi:tRNA-modifying protein YgfZ
MPNLKPAECIPLPTVPPLERATAPSFGDPEGEFQAALNGTAVADNSLFGRIEVTGIDRLDLLHRLSTNSLALLPAGGAASTIFVTDKGRVIDRVIVSALSDSLLLITSPGAEEILTRWIEKYTITEDIRFRTVTGETIMISLIGPRIISMFSDLTGSSVPANTSVSLEQGGAHMSVVRVQDARSDIAHIIAGRAAADLIVESLGSIPGARWIGRSAYEGFRITRGIASFPGEINDAYNPFECGLRDSISFTKGCYIGQEVIARLDTYGKIRRHLIRVTGAGALPGPVPLKVSKNGAEAGMLTSMTGIPFDGKYLGLAIVRNDVAPGDTLAAGATVVVAGTSPDA